MRCFRAFHNLAPIIHCRTVSRLTAMSCFLAKYSEASVGPNPRYTGRDRIDTEQEAVAILARPRYRGGRPTAAPAELPPHADGASGPGARLPVVPVSAPR